MGRVVEADEKAQEISAIYDAADENGLLEKIRSTFGN